METPVLAFLSGMDLVAILLIALLLFGAKRLPEIAKSLGNSIKEFKRASNEMTAEIERGESKPPTPPAPTALPPAPPAPNGGSPAPHA